MNSSDEELIKSELGTSLLEDTGKGGGGCISSGKAYQTDNGIVFVKYNTKSEATRMFDGEFASLAALHASEQVLVPKPIKVVRRPKGGAMLVMEYLEMSSLHKHAATLGQQMARLHLHNSEVGKKAKLQEHSVHSKGENPAFVSKFGFDVTTCCGAIPQNNEWTESWVEFYARKIEDHVRIAEQKHNDRDARPIWSGLGPNLHRLFEGVDEIQPALLHGDLWGGNAAEVHGGPVIFDPASFYGHSEFDLAISQMFGGFGRAYFQAYHQVLPKQPGFDDRQDLYMMFHYLNHWNHFGGGYKGTALNLMKRLAKKYTP